MTLPVRTPGLAHVRISGTTFRRRLRQSELRARRPVVGPILKQRQRIWRLACAGACRRWRLYTWQQILFSDESRFSLRYSDGRYREYCRRGAPFYGPVCVRVRQFWRRKCYGLSWKLS